jgi:D-amino-acid oxidase
VTDLVRLDRVPAPYQDGWCFTAPVVEMPVYLRWLAHRLVAAGGTVTRMALPALPTHAEIVVNCAGLGAVGLAHDTAMLPVRGQVVLVEQIGLDQWWLDASGPTYVVPRAGDIVVGGTDGEGEWDRRPDRNVAAAILERARMLVPELEAAKVVAHRVGLRPVRPTVRLEAEPGPSGGTVIHCYGHGGAGVTASWGCADEVAALVDAAAARDVTRAGVAQPRRLDTSRGGWSA